MAPKQSYLVARGISFPPPGRKNCPPEQRIRKEPGEKVDTLTAAQVAEFLECGAIEAIG
jgi:hypothetical protein